MSNSANKKWIVGVWTGESFQPASEHDLELVQHLKKGARVRLDVTEFRSLPRNAFYWVVLRLVVENTEYFATAEALHKTLLVGCGVVEPVISLDGEILMTPASTAFDKMGEGDFKAYFDRAMQIIQERIIPGIDLKLLIREADRKSGGTRKPHHPA